MSLHFAHADDIPRQQGAPDNFSGTVYFQPVAGNEACGLRAARVTFAPGAGDTHTHPYAHVGVILTKGKLAFADKGKPEEVVDFEAGSAGYREAKVTHLVRNPGKEPMKVIEVEVK